MAALADDDALEMNAPIMPPPVVSDLVRRSGPRLLTKPIINRLERLAHAGQDVDLVIQIRKGEVWRTGHMPFFTHNASIFEE